MYIHGEDIFTYTLVFHNNYIDMYTKLINYNYMILKSGHC